MKLINIKKFSVMVVIALAFCMVTAFNVFAEDVVTEPVTQAPVTEPITEEIVTEPITQEVVTEPITEPITEAVTQEPVTEPITEPITEPVTQEPETEPVTQDYVQDSQQQEYTTVANYDVNELPTLVDSTQVAEDLPTAIGADDDGGVSFVGGVVCWVAVGISACVIVAFLLSTKGKGKSGVGRYDRGTKYNNGRY